MDILKIYLKFAKVLKQSKGFTLIELLVAIAMSGIVLTGLGAGMMALLNSSNSSNAKTNVKNQLNRAIDYINEDIKRARFAGIATTNATGDTLRLIYFESAAANVSHYIDYFMTSSSNPWFGPNVIRRSVDGGTSQVLVDGITDNSGITFPSCTPTGTITTTTTTETIYTTGFKACVTKESVSNRSVDVYRINISLFGELSNSTEIKVETQSIARSVSPELTPPTLKSDPNEITISLDPTPVIIWNLVPGSVSYQIYRCTVPVDQEICTPTESSTVVYNNAIPSFTETENAPVGSRWCYAGSSSDGVNASPLGNVVCAAVSNGGLPATVTNLDASDTVVPTVTWGEAIDATTYSLYRCPADATATCTPNTLVFGPETQLSFTETETPPANKKWCYAVQANNDEGASTLSDVDCGLVNSSAIPNVPTITIDASNTNIVNWSDESASGATSYALYQCEIGAGSTCPPTTLVTGFPQFTHTFTQSVAAAIDNRWCYAVKAVNTTPDPDQESALSSPPVCGDVALAAPSFTNTPFSGVTPTVNWSSVADATSYELYRCTTADLSTVCNPSTGVEVTTANYANTSYTESSEPPNSNRHCYAVRAKNSGGSSVFSATSCGAEKIAVCTIPNIMGYSSSTADQRTFIINQVTNAGFGAPTTVNQDSGTGAGETVWSVSPVVGSTVVCSSAITIKWKEGAGVAVPPNAPILISVSGANTNNSTVALTWVSGGGGMAVSYDVYRCIASSGTCNPTSGGTLVGSNIGFTFANNGPVDLQGNNNACYAVRAKNSGGTSGFSNQRCDK